MNNTKSRNLNVTPVNKYVTFANNLCAHLNDPTADHCLNNRYFHHQCAGITGKGKRCRHKVKVEVAYDGAETNPPIVHCHMHGDVSQSTTLHMVIQETMCGQIITHQCVGIGTSVPVMKDPDTTAYQILHYVGDNLTPRPQLLEDGRVGVGCDKVLWIDPKTCLRIYYVREAGQIRLIQVSAKNQLDDHIQAYKIAVETEMIPAGSGGCAVCLETKPLWNLGCGGVATHAFCQDCIARFACKKAVCPMCRSEIPCLDDLANRQRELDQYQLESPDYVVHTLELTPECATTFAYRIRIKSHAFRYPDVYFSPQQELEYRILVLLLEHKLVFKQSSYDEAVYVRSPIFLGIQLKDRLRDRDDTLVQDFARFALECGLDEIDLLLGGVGPPTTP